MDHLDQLGLEDDFIDEREEFDDAICMEHSAYNCVPCEVEEALSYEDILEEMRISDGIETAWELYADKRNKGRDDWLDWPNDLASYLGGDAAYQDGACLCAHCYLSCYLADGWLDEPVRFAREQHYRRQDRSLRRRYGVYREQQKRIRTQPWVGYHKQHPLFDELVRRLVETCPSLEGKEQQVRRQVLRWLNGEETIVPSTLMRDELLFVWRTLRQWDRMPCRDVTVEAKRSHLRLVAYRAARQLAA